MFWDMKHKFENAVLKKYIKIEIMINVTYILYRFCTLSVVVYRFLYTKNFLD